MKHIEDLIILSISEEIYQVKPENFEESVSGTPVAV